MYVSLNNTPLPHLSLTQNKNFVYHVKDGFLKFSHESLLTVQNNLYFYFYLQCSLMKMGNVQIEGLRIKDVCIYCDLDFSIYR